MKSSKNSKMIIELEHRSLKKKINNKWIYFGGSYKYLKNLQKRIDKNYEISLTNEIYLKSLNNRKIFLNWLEEQRNSFNDSIYWWMNGLPSRNNFSSNFFIYICQLSAILDFIKNHEKIEKITIISENYFLIKTLGDNLKQNYDIKNPNFLNIKNFFEKLKFIFLGIINYLKLISFFAVHYFFSFLSRSKKFDYPTGDVYLFHDLISSKDFKNSIVQSRYFGDYADWLSKSGKKVLTLPWFYRNLKNKKSVYKNLRSKESFIPEDWLNPVDYFGSIIKSLKSAFTINEKIVYPGLNILELIKTQKLLSLENKSAIYFRYLPALKKWSKNLNSLTFIDNYQNQIFEFPMRFGLKKLNIKTKSIGYFHSLHSENFLPYQSNINEWESDSKPSSVICPNELCKKVLNFQGIPSQKLKVASDLQRQTFTDIELIKKNNKNLLIVLSLFPDSNYEILNKISKISDYLIKDLNLNIKVRSHPYLNNYDILKNLKWSSLPYKWEWSKKNLMNDLSDSNCIITMHTAIVSDAIFLDNMTIILKSELNIGENYLDCLEGKYPILKATPEKDLKNKINDIFLKEINFYKEEYTKIKKDLILNINKSNYNLIID